MAEELVDRVIQEKALDKVTKVGPCVTKGIKLVGGDGYHDLLYVQLIQKYGVSEHIAKHLCHTYGAAAFAVCEQRTKDPKKAVPVGKVLVEGYPFIEAEIEYAAKNEYAVTAKDMLTLRMRLAYLNSEAAKKNAQLRARTYTDLTDIFTAVDKANTGYIDEAELSQAMVKLGFPFKDKEDAKATFTGIDKDGTGRITQKEFIEWWNKTSFDDFSRKLHKQLTLTAANEVAIDKLATTKEEDRKKA